MGAGGKTRLYAIRNGEDARPDVFFFDSLRGKPGTGTGLFKPSYAFAYDLAEVTDPAEADVLVLSQPITDASERTRRYLETVKSSYSRYGKPIALFVGGDLSNGLDFPGFAVLKGTQFKSSLKKNEIIIPPYCEDFKELYGSEPRKKGNKAVIGFCGWAGFDRPADYAKYLIKNFVFDMESALSRDPSRQVYKKGIYFRRKAIRAIRKSDRVAANLIVRKSFSGSPETISISPEQARREYTENMRGSDFVLAPKGDANYSVRFFEALSFGRIPILVDTDVCLPLEEEIDYSSCIVRVNYRDLDRLPEIVADFYAGLTEERFAAMQKNARETFEKYLRYDSFWNRVFPRIASGAAGQSR